MFISPIKKWEEKSWMKCVKCGEEVPLFGNNKFTCGCGGLYDVCHLPSFLDGQTPHSLRRLFDERRVSSANGPLQRSGVWRFYELIMPSLPVKDIVTLGEGIIPMWPARSHLSKWIGGDLDLWIMPEGLTPTGSFKDFGGTVAMSVAKASGVKRIGCASTGDTSAMAAAYAAAAGIECSVVLPSGLVTSVQLAQPLAFGAKIILIPGVFDECMRVIRELSDSGRIFPINSINPTRIEGHQATVFLACQFFGWKMPDAFVVPVGNGSNSSSIGKGMRLLHDLGICSNIAKLIGVQSKAANPLALSWEHVQMNGVVKEKHWLQAYAPLNANQLGRTAATAAFIGKPVSYCKVIREVCHSGGAVLSVLENELCEAVMVAGKDGYFICPQTGTALAGLRQAVLRGFVQKGQRVVVVSTATGLKFTEVPAEIGKDLIIKSRTTETSEIADLIGV